MPSRLVSGTLAPWKYPHMQTIHALDQELIALIGMMECDTRIAFEHAVVNHVLNVGGHRATPVQEHILRYAYFVWCRKTSAPYIVISPDAGHFTLILNITPLDNKGISDRVLRRLEGCALPGEMTYDGRGRFAAAMPLACARGVASDLYRIAAPFWKRERDRE